MRILRSAMGLRRGAIATFAIVGALLLGACSGSSAKVAAATNSSSSPPSSSSGGAAFQAYRDCLSQHGVTLPARPSRSSGSSGSSGSGSSDGASSPDQSGGRGGFGQFSLPPGVDQATFDAAQQACASLRPAGGGGGRLGGTAAAAYRSCLADHGVTLPAPSSDSTSSAPPPSINRNDPAFKAANDACRALLPGRGNGSTTTTSTP